MGAREPTADQSELQLADDELTLLRKLKSTKSVWIMTVQRFVSPARVALSTGGLNFQPHLFKLPAFLRPLESLVKLLGVQDTFEHSTLEWAVRESRSKEPFEEPPPPAKLHAMLSSSRDEGGGHETFMSTCAPPSRPTEDSPTSS